MSKLTIYRIDPVTRQRVSKAEVIEHVSSGSYVGRAADGKYIRSSINGEQATQAFLVDDSHYIRGRVAVCWFYLIPEEHITDAERQRWQDEVDEKLAEQADNQRKCQIAQDRISSLIDFVKKDDKEWAQWAITQDNISHTLLPVLERIAKQAEHRQSIVLEQAAASDYFGSVNERVSITATVEFTTSFDSQFGTRYLTVLKDDSGNVLKYWNNITIQNGDQPRWATKGDRIEFKATIKAHEDYQGVKQTVLSRASKAKLSEEQPT